MSRQITKTCLACEQKFRASRTDARACSERCRKRLYRAKMAVETEAESFKDEAKEVFHQFDARLEQTAERLEDSAKEIAEEVGTVIAPNANEGGYVEAPVMGAQPAVTPTSPVAPPPVEAPISAPVPPTSQQTNTLVQPTPSNVVAPAEQAAPPGSFLENPNSGSSSGLPFGMSDTDQAGQVFNPVDPNASSTLEASPMTPSASPSMQEPAETIASIDATSPHGFQPKTSFRFLLPKHISFKGLAGATLGAAFLIVVLIYGSTFPFNKNSAVNNNGSTNIKVNVENVVTNNDSSIHLKRTTYIDNGQPLIASGAVDFKNQKDSNAAFQVQNSSGSNLLIVDTLNNKVGINTTPTANGATLQVGGNISATGSLQAGGNTSLNPANLVINSKTVCTAEGCSVGPQATNISAGQITAGTLSDNHLSPNVALLDANQTFSGNNSFTGKVVFQNAVNGSSNFEIQDANGTGDLLMVDTVSGKVGIGRTPLATTNAILQVNGSVDLTGQITFNGNQINTLNLSDSSNIARLDANQTYTGNNTFSGNLIALNLQPASSTLSVGALTSELDLQGNLSSGLTASDGNFNIKIGFAGTPTGNITYNFNAAASPGTYEICTTVGNCVGSGGSVATPGGNSNHLAKFTGADTIADSSITDNGSTVSIGEPGVFRAGANSATAFRVQNAGGLVDLLVADTTDSRVGVGLTTGSPPQYPLDVAGDINSSTGLRVGGTLVCTAGGCGAGSGSGFYIQNGTATQVANFNVQSGAIGSIVAVLQGASGQTADILDAKDGNSNKVLTVNNTGSVLIQPSSNSQSAFVVESASPGNTKVLAADTANNRVAVNQATANYTLDVNGDINISTGSFFRINGTSICGPQATCAPSAGSAFYIQNANTLQTGANFNISSANINYVVGVLRGALGQVGDLLDLQNGSGNNVLAVNATGSVLAQASTNSTTAFQIQNTTGTSNLFVADTTNSRIGIGTAAPTATLSVNGTGLFQAPAIGSSNSLTVSGNEITDAVRTTNTQGDGRAAPDSTYGIWEGTTNLIGNGGFESNTSGWGGTGNATVSRDNTHAKFGSWALKVSTLGVATNEGSQVSGGTGSMGYAAVTAGNTYTASSWVYSPSGGERVSLNVDEVNSSGAYVTSWSTQAVTLSTGWQRLTRTNVVDAGISFLSITIRTTTTPQAIVVWQDAVQVEQKAIATPYVETNGATASRASARVQGSATATNMSGTQGWVAMRVRMPYSASSYSSSGSNPPRFWSWGTSFQDFQVFIQTGYNGSIGFSRNSGRAGAASVNSSVAWANPGDLITIVAAWDANGIYLSTNGSNFVTGAGAGIPPSLPNTFDIGTQNGGNALDADVVWTAEGTGTLTNTDSANINAFGNTDPNLGSFASGAASTFVWQANTAAYQYPGFQPIVFQVQNNSGSQIFGIDANASAVLLPNSTSATAALILGNDSNANLYRSAASTLATSGTFQAAVGLQTPSLDTITTGILSIGTTNATGINLNQNTVIAAGKSLTANGTALFKNSVDSTGAFTIQNAAGTSNLFVADTSDSRLGVATATPLTTFNVSGTGLFQGASNSANSLTVSGNEVTDITRTINQQGDGRVAPDSSYGIWEATTNLITNGGFESNTTGWTTNQSGLSLPQDTSVSKFGGASMKVVNDGSVTNQGAVEPTGSRPSVSANTIYTLSAWVQGTPGAHIVLEAGNFNGTTNINFLVSPSVTLTGSWQRVIFTFTTPASTTNVAPIFIDNTPSVPVTFWLDGVQLEQRNFATPYVETNGATATRNAAHVQAPATNISAAQGFIATRVRMAYPSNTFTGTTFPGVFRWNDASGGTTTNQILIYVYANIVTIKYTVNGSVVAAGTAALSWNAGDTLTIVAYWKPGQLGISVNGSSFGTIALPTTISASMGSTFDIGNGDSLAQIDSDTLWTATGTGTLTNTDATNINNFGNTDPYITNFSQAAYPTMVWAANNGTYQSGTSLALQVQNSSGANLLNVRADNSTLTVAASTKLQNLVDSTNALTVTNAAGAQLFNINTSNLQVSAANLQSSGSVNIVNSQGSVALAPGISSPNSLTVSGNEITDVVRAAGASTTNIVGQSYDGKTNDSSTGIWEATTNLVINGGLESSTGGWQNAQAGGTLTRVTTDSKFGSASIRVDTGAGQGIATQIANWPIATAGQIYTGSAWVKGVAGRTMQVELLARDEGNNNAILTTSIGSVVANGTWQRVTTTLTTPAPGVGSTGIYISVIDSVNGGNTTFFADGIQLEQKAYATPYVETNGATASRNLAAIQAPMSNINSTQGWFAARVRVGFSSTVTTTNANNPLMSLDDGTLNNRLEFFWDSTNKFWKAHDVSGGVAGADPSITDTFSAGDLRTVIFKWDASTVSVSLGGSVFTTAINNLRPINPTGLFIGSAGFGTTSDGDILWTAMGTGGLTNNDIATLNNFGNTDPTLAKLLNLNGGSAAPTLVWNGSTAAYQDSTSSNGQALIYAANTSASLTGNLIDLQSGSVPASKFNVDTSGNTTIAGTLTLGGSAIKPISDSTSAIQIQNSLGSALLTVDSTNSQISLGPAGPTPVTFVVGVKNTTGDPATGTNGEIYYNSFSNVFRCFQAGVWVNCTGSGGGGGGGGDVNQGGNSFGTAMVLGTNDNNSLSLRTNAVNVLTLGTNGSALFKNAADSTTAFQIQSSTSSTLFVADTTNSRIGVGTATPAATLAVNGSGLFQQSTVTNLLTVSGNEITDATRTANTQGDGQAAPDSSYGIWEATTNGLKNGGFESNTTSWTTSGSGIETITTDTSKAKFGSSSLKTITDGTAINQGAAGGNSDGPTAASGQTWTDSAWVWAPVGASMQAFFAGRDASNVLQEQTIISFTGTGAWQRISITRTLNNATTNHVSLTVMTNAAQAITFWVDGVQIEQKAYATPYVETNGAAASRNAAQVQAPSSTLTSTQGWVAARVRMDVAAASYSNFATVFGWENVAGTNGYEVQFRNTGQNWKIQSDSTGAQATNPVSTPGFTNAGDYVTVVAYWTSSTLGISINGSNFFTTSSANAPTGLPSLFQWGDRLNGSVSQWLDGDTMWGATGTGTLTNTDATSINAFGNTDPSLSSFPGGGTPTMVWKANTAAYQNSANQSAVLSVQDSTGSNLLNVNADSSQLTANTSALFKNAINSTTALQVQNAAGVGIFGVNTSTGAVNLGTPGASGSNGQIVLNSTNAGGFGVTIAVSSSLAASYTLKLPTAAPTQGQCLQIDSLDASQLNFATCAGGGGSTDLQGAYNNSATPATIVTASAAKGVLVKAGATADSTTVFQVQNSSGSTVLAADTLNNRVAIGTSVALATLQVNGTGLLQGTSNSPNNLTVSGNEITDANRAQNYQGDGRTAPDSSEGIWEGTTNLLANGTPTNTTGFSNNDGIATITRDPSVPIFGTASIKVSTQAGFSGIRTTQSLVAYPTITSGTTYTASVWANIPNGTLANLTAADASNSFAAVAQASIVGTGALTRYTLTFTPGSSGTASIMVTGQSGTPAFTFWVGGWQLEQKPIATPYVATSTATAARNASSATATSSLLNATQGWVAARVRMSGSSAARSNTAYLFHWGTSNNTDFIGLRWSTGQSWVLETAVGGVSNTNTITNTGGVFTDGTLLTVVASWTSTTMNISVNGGAFTTITRTVGVPSMPGTFDIGSNSGSTSFLDGDVLWSSTGTGTLTNTDATNINNFGNTDPYITNFAQAAASTMVWHANSASYQTGNSLAFQIQNSSGANLFNVNSASAALVAGASAKFQNLTDSTAAFQIQNASGQSNLLVADTSDTRLGIGTATPVATVNVVGSQLIQQGAATNLIVSGNEITDATRTAATQGDGRAAPDSSEGIWEGTTNLVTNGGFETNTTGWIGNASGSTPVPTIGRVNSTAKFGTSSLSVATQGANVFEGISSSADTAVTASTPYSLSAWVLYPAGKTVRAEIDWKDASHTFQNKATTDFTGTGAWQKISVTGTSLSNAAFASILILTNNSATSAAATNFNVDGIQLEQKTAATPYVETNGATASRSLARVQAPSSNINATQGWASFRVRAGVANTAITTSTRFFEWDADTNNKMYLGLVVSAGPTYTWKFGRTVGGVDIATSIPSASFNAGDLITATIAWTSTQLAVSINGGAFVTASNTQIPNMSNAPTFDIGSIGGNNGTQWDGDVLWTAAGTGTLSNTDAANLNNFGNTDPMFNQLPAVGTPTMLWKANNSNYSGSSNADTAFQVNNSLGTSLLSLDATNAKLTVSTAGLFQNATNSSNALTVNTAAGTQLFNVNTSNLQVSTNNLQSSGAVNLTNASGTVSLAGSLQSTSTLTTTGNEITDASRTINTQGDGKTPPDSSYGIWEATTNLVLNGGAETNTSSITTWGPVGTTITRDTTTSKFGSGSFKTVANSGGANQGIAFLGTGTSGHIPASASTTYTFSVWLKGNTGGEALGIAIGWYDSGGIAISSSAQSITVTNGWARYSITATSPVGTASVYVNVADQNSATVTWFSDGAQFEQKPMATPYVETNGAAATRNAARVQASATNLNATQGWVAMRLKMGFPSTATSSIVTAGGGTSLTLFSWQNDNNNRILITLDLNDQINVVRQINGVGNNVATSPQTWNTDDAFTVVAAWDAGNLYLSVNGSAFLKVSNTNIPALTAALFDIGRRSDPTTSGWIDSNILWTASGTGVLSNSDPTTLNNLGNTDPTLAKLYSLNTGAGQPTLVWNGNTANFQDVTSSNGQALIYASNTSGVSTGNLIDVQSGAFPSSRFSVSTTGQTLVQTSVNSTAAFQVQNSSGSNVLVVDTVNNQIGINTSTPNATLAVNGTGLIQASSATNPTLTVSGNEITDATRTTNLQGDGRTPPDSSEGIWEATTNMLINGGFESTASPWSDILGTGGVISRSTSTSKFGSASGQIVTNGSVTGQGTGSPSFAVTPSTTYTFSTWVNAPNGSTLTAYIRERTAGDVFIQDDTTNFTGTGKWQRVTVTATLTASTGLVRVGVMTFGAQVVTFNIDGLQFEQKTIASPYVETSGSTSARPNARVQVPAALLSQTQGWFAARVRPGFPAANSISGFQEIMSWNDPSINNGLQLMFRDSDKTWRMRVISNSSALGDATSAVQNFNAGDTLTIIGYWTPTQAAISVNGSAFVTLGLTLPTFTGLSNLVDIGSQLGSASYFNGDVLWTASGTGTLTNTDANNINTFGNTDPAMSSFVGIAQPTFVWRANSSSYINSPATSPLTFNVQNSSGASLFNIDSDLSSVNLQSATTANSALTFGNDTVANLYRSTTGTLQTSGSLVVTNNLTTNGNIKVQTTTNSTTALQVQNSAGTNLLIADTTNNRVGIGAAPSVAPTAATFQVTGSSSVQTAASALTVSGNEITDATRTTNTQGDGRAVPDSSYGIWEGTTNLVSNGGMETNATGWTAGGSNTVTRDTSRAKFGSASLKAAYQNNIQLGLFNNITVTSGQTYTASAWVYVPGSYNGTQPQLEIDSASVAIPLGTRNAWQRVKVTFTATSSSENLTLIERGTVPTAGQSIYLDGVQVENKPIATPYAETNGAPATRAAARVQAPATGLNATQGWFSTRVRMGWGATSAPGTFPTIIDWRNDNSNKLTIYYTSSSQVFTVERRAAGSSTQAISATQSFNAGDILTISGYWTPTTLSISVNGGAFASVANTNVPTITATSYDVGSVGLNSQLDSDILWTATGTGTLTNGDATAINALGNADPDVTFFSSTDSSSTPTMVWKANNANYQNQLAFSVQNSTSANLLGVDVADGSVLLSNANSSAGALVLGRDANLYRVASQTLKTDGALTIGTNLTVNGSAILQNATNSTGALRIQNSDGTNTVLAADTTNGRIAINQTTANYALDVNGDINTTGLYRVNGIQIASSNLSDSADIAKLSVNNTFTGANIFNNALNSFTGDGNGLTNLNGTNIATGTVADGRLSADVALLNANQTYSGNIKFQNASDSGSAVQIQNAAGTSNLFMADTTHTRVGIAAASPGYTLDVGGDINSSGLLRLNGAQISTTNLLDGSNIGLLNASNIFTGTNNLFKPGTDSTTAFQIQGSTGQILLVADTVNTRIYIGTPGGDSVGATLVLGAKTTAGDPAGTNGAIYYNASAGKFRCYENGSWQNCIFGAQATVKTADQAISSTSYGNINDIGFAVGANKNYLLQCSLLTSITGTGGNISMNGPASPTSYTATFMKTSDQSAGDQFTTSSTYNDPNPSSAFQVVTSTSGSSQFVLAYTAVLKNGANAGTWQLVAKAQSGGTLTLYAGSTCDLRPF